jgi:antitoxin component YwqK of YwqJK toxin-antitoxin module
MDTYSNDETDDAPDWFAILEPRLDVIKASAISMTEWGSLYPSNQEEKYSGWIVEYGRNGNLRLVSKFVNSNFDGPTIQWYENGNKFRQEFWEMGLAKGWQLEWYENGQIKDEIRTFKGNRIERHWHPNGQLYWEIPYHNFRQEGIATFWDERGNKSKDVNYLQGKRHGPSISWDANGNPTEEINYVQDKRHGPSFSWASSGKVLSRSFYENGKKLNWIQSKLAFKKLNDCS